MINNNKPKFGEREREREREWERERERERERELKIIIRDNTWLSKKHYLIFLNSAKISIWKLKKSKFFNNLKE
jgi:hypothetical protein